jgi:hypothetical protein
MSEKNEVPAVTTLTMEKFQIGIVQPYLDRPGLKEKAHTKVQNILDQFKHKRNIEWFEAELSCMNDDPLDRTMCVAAKCIVTEVYREGEQSTYRLVEGITPPYLPRIEE